jgi:hypothetical protein
VSDSDAEPTIQQNETEEVNAVIEPVEENGGTELHNVVETLVSSDSPRPNDSASEAWNTSPEVAESNLLVDVADKDSVASLGRVSDDPFAAPVPANNDEVDTNQNAAEEVRNSGDSANREPLLVDDVDSSPSFF